MPVRLRSETNPRFRDHLREQRWDDHRYYHHSVINQSLHFVSAATFLVAYAIAWNMPWLAALLGWGVAVEAEVVERIGHDLRRPDEPGFHVADEEQLHRAEQQPAEAQRKPHHPQVLQELDPVPVRLEQAEQ